jgi:hypothetical protein
MKLFRKCFVKDFRQTADTENIHEHAVTIRTGAENVKKTPASAGANSYRSLFNLAVITCILFLFAMAGCMRGYIINVDSISDSAFREYKTYILIPGNKGTTINDLQFKEYAAMLVRAMSLQGYILSDPEIKPDIEVYFSYGIGEPETHTYSYSEPVYGRTGMNIYTRITNHTSSYDVTTQNSSTFMEPQYGITGYTNKTGEFTSYKKFIVLDAYDIKDANQGNKLKAAWKTSIYSEGKSRDLRKVFPGLLAGASEYIGRNTGEILVVQIAEDSPVLKKIKGFSLDK